MVSDERTWLMNAISDALGIRRVAKGVGSSVQGDFLNPCLYAVGLDPESYSNKYRRFEALLNLFGQPYDMYQDSSEWSPTGGGTITNVGLQKLLDGIAAASKHALAGQSELPEEDPYEEVLDLSQIQDARERVLREIAARRGQTRFRRDLLAVYEGRCAVTAFDAVDALEAAHITPYRGDHTHTVNNGLLLRADIHTLFDTGLLGVDPDDGFKVSIAQRLRGTAYEGLENQPIHLPYDEAHWPQAELLRWHLATFRLE